MQIIILAGGKGTRAYPYTEYLPKPMIPVLGKPVMVRIIELFTAQGYNDFIIAVGHNKEVITDYFDGRNIAAANVTLIDTGPDADTGQRILACREMINGPFLATYGDGICDVDLRALT